MHVGRELVALDADLLGDAAKLIPVLLLVEHGINLGDANDELLEHDVRECGETSEVGLVMTRDQRSLSLARN